jgi:hypothetical protein
VYKRLGEARVELPDQASVGVHENDVRDVVVVNILESSSEITRVETQRGCPW